MIPIWFLVLFGGDTCCWSAPPRRWAPRNAGLALEFAHPDLQLGRPKEEGPEDEETSCQNGLR